jgi:hypothetical protein
MTQSHVQATVALVSVMRTSRTGLARGRNEITQRENYVLHIADVDGYS